MPAVYYHGGKRYGSGGSSFMVPGYSGKVQQPILDQSVNYGGGISGLKRHQVVFDNSASFIPLATGAYVGITMLQFIRTRPGGIVNDQEPVPTASNNFQTTSVMNGSRIENYMSKQTFKSTTGQGVITLDVYESALSYYDALVWNTLFPTACPVVMDTTTVAPADVRGQVTQKAMVASQVDADNHDNFKFVQKYLKYKGSLTLTGLGGDASIVELIADRVPPQCRRSQTGMHWALWFKNDGKKNNGLGITLGSATNEVSFEEFPSDRRLPFIE